MELAWNWKRGWNGTELELEEGVEWNWKRAGKVLFGFAVFMNHYYRIKKGITKRF
jgi:hypothetical protein